MMPLFHKKTLEKSLIVTDIPPAHFAILSEWRQRILNRDLENQSELALHGVFMQKILVDILGYQPFGAGEQYNIAKEYRIERGLVDLALGEFFNDKQGDKIHAVFELKGAKTNLDSIMSGRFKTPVEQAWEYATNAKSCEWILVSNYKEIRLYAFGYTKFVYESFDLTKLIEPLDYARFIFCLQANHLLSGRTKQLLLESEQASIDITHRFYADYTALRETIITRFIAENADIPPLDLIAPAQKLLDRILFIAFCEDRGLIPQNSIKKAYEFINIYEPQPIYHNFRGLFKAVNRGNLLLNVQGYNGGLFAPDKVLDKLPIADEICEGFLALAHYDFNSEISVTVLGRIFEQSITDLEEIAARIKAGKPVQKETQNTAVSGKRKQHGIVYTPDHITAFIVEHTLESYLNQQFTLCLSEFQFKKDGERHWKKGAKTELNFWKTWLIALKQLKIVDPACGSGAFLVAAFDYLHQEYDKVNAKIAELSQSPSVFDLNKEILHNNLFGVDINCESIEITKLSLWLKTAERGKKLASIDAHFQIGNSLGIDCPVALNLPGLKDLEGLGTGFYWQNHFATIMENGGFDIVLGNPPYVRQELISDFKPYLQSHYAVYHGVADLYAYFFELGLKILKPNGVLGFISSSTFFKTSSGEPLRTFLTEKATLKVVLDFGDLQVFEGVTTYPAILIFQNKPPEMDNEIRFLRLNDTLPEKLTDYFKAHYQIMPHSQLNAAGWELEQANLNQLRAKLTHGFPTLKEVYGSPYRGIVTGLNEAFVINSETKAKLIQQDKNSAQLLKPFLEGKDLKKWHSQSRDLWLIFIPKGWTQTKMGKLLDESTSWQWFQSYYPAIAQWLEPFAEAARKRTDKGEFFWELRACAYYAEFEKPKMVWGNLQNKASFAVDNSRYFINAPSPILVIDDIYFVNGILNSKITWFQLEQIAIARNGGYIECKPMYIEQILIPPATAEQKETIAYLAQQCQALSEARYKLEKTVQFSIGDLGVNKLTRKLENAWELEFKAFLAELAKQKITIPLKKHSEWRDFLQEMKHQHDELNQQIVELENRLNSIVYTLFDLSAEEIKLIEK